MIRKILALSLVVGIVMSVLSCSKPEKYNEEDLWLQSFGAQKHEIYIVTTRPINVSPIVSNVLSTINYIDSVYIYIEGDADMRDGFEIAMPHERRIDITVYASAGLIYAAFLSAKNASLWPRSIVPSSRSTIIRLAYARSLG